MEFNKLVIERLEPIFIRYNLRVTEQLKNYIRYNSPVMIITLIHDERENSNSIYIGKDEEWMFPITDSMIKNVFNQKIKIDYGTIPGFINNLALFFQGKGSLILEGDPLIIKKLDEVLQAESAEYTSNLLLRQSLKAADQAWANGNYFDFIMFIDKIDQNKIPPTYYLKYKYAKKQL